MKLRVPVVLRRFSCLAAALAAGGLLHAVEPVPLSYQGRLTDAQGNPRNGTFSVVFGIYDQSTGGILQFSDTQPSVVVSSGVLTALIGTGTTVGTLGQTMTGGTDRYLQITVGGNVLLPRQRLAANPYALSVAAGSVGTAGLADNAVTNAKLQSGIFGNITGVGTQAQNLDMGNKFVVNLATPTLGSQAATKGYVDGSVGAGVADGSVTNAKLQSGIFGNITGVGVQAQNLDMGNKLIVNLATPTLGSQAATKGYVDGSVGAGVADGSVTNAKLQSGIFGNITGVGVQAQNLDMGNKLIVNLATPTLGSQAATKGYVDSNAGVADGTVTNAKLQSGDFDNITGVGTQAQDLDMGNKFIVNLGKVGVGTPSPNVALDVNGAVALRRMTLNITGGPFNSLAIGSASFVKITGPGSNFLINGIANGFDGRVLVLYNGTTSNRNMVLADASSPGAAAAQDQILTGTGAMLSTTGEGTITLIYDGEQSKWIVTSIQP